VRISLEMTRTDFNHLVLNQFRWAGAGSMLTAQQGRFEHATEKYDTPPSPLWKTAYALGTSWADVMLARAWLESNDHPYEIILDTAVPLQYLILTDYGSAAREGAGQVPRRPTGGERMPESTAGVRASLEAALDESIDDGGYGAIGAAMTVLGPLLARAEAAEATVAALRDVLLEGGQDDASVRRRALAILSREAPA
jgi:hypothetical protein